MEIIPGGLEGKWLSETVDDARAWGRAFARVSSVSHDKILVVSVADHIAARLFRLARLDNIGPARFAEAADLPAFMVEEVMS